ncbi:beta-amyrin 16-alpha-hydroxylase CYP87D16 [Ziziphus jujuba]|uniref:Beta-amyrin 16-alpha-hydroxylase CYP87D16 n=1 Tax=Ziziphus jujuba TaxID=326968 RepID=A0ABM3IX91_ZIZJJ|nr:beta-amyrin 16-alpha-hydroxylase CYP87D16 [Ziziphus jujuba]
MSTLIGIMCIVALLAICISHYWIMIRWRNPKFNNKNKKILPPGSMGWPFIGETLHLIIPSYSLDLHPFIKTRILRYGTIFRTSLVGRPVVISADPEFNNYILLQEGKLVELYYLDTFSNIFKQTGDDQFRPNAAGLVHKYVRSIFLSHFGAEILKTKLLNQIEEFVERTLFSWSNQASVEVKRAASEMVLNFSAKQIFSYDAEKAPFDLSEKYMKIIDGLMSFPLNVPGTAYHKCSKDKEKVTNMIRDMLKHRQNSPRKGHEGDFLDQIISDMDKEEFLTEDFIVQLVFGVLFATFESVSVIVALAFQLLSEHPSALQELTAEHEAILEKRENTNSFLTWDEYKSMTFTLQVINETLRLGNVAPGLLRRALKDIPVKGKGFTIPADWTIMVVTSALHMSPNAFEDPLAFNPWRWKDLEQHVITKNFTPFGGGMRQCAGAEYSRVFLSTFFHVLLTKYRWTKIKGGEIARSPILGFGKGIHIKFTNKHKIMVH